MQERRDDLQRERALKSAMDRGQAAFQRKDYVTVAAVLEPVADQLD